MSVIASINNHGIPYQAYRKAVEPPYQGLVCEYILEELRRVFNRKFPYKVPMYERFIAAALPAIEIIPVPSSRYSDEDLIRDIGDRPILRAAIKAGVDVLISGDNDFLESAVTTPRIMTATQFLQWSP